MASISEWQQFYGTGNYADQSRRIGTAVEEAIGQNRVKVDRIRATEDRRRKMEMEDFAMATLKRKEYQGLQIPADGEYEDIDARYQQAARQIPDAWADIVAKGVSGEFSAEQVAMGQANLTKQVGDLKNLKANVTAERDQVMGMIKNGEVSSFNTVEEVDYATTLLLPNNGLKIETDGRNMYLKGKTASNGDDINIALSKYGQHPQLTKKAADPRAAIKGINKIAYDRDQATSVDNADLVDSWKDSYANLTDQLGEKGSKGLAMDWMDFSREEVEELSNGNTNNVEGGYKPEGSDTTYSSELDFLMEEKYLQMGQDTFLNSRNQALDQEYKSLRNKSLKNELKGKAAVGALPPFDAYNALSDAMNPADVENRNTPGGQVYGPSQPNQLQDTADEPTIGDLGTIRSDPEKQYLRGKIKKPTTIKITPAVQSAISGLGFGPLESYKVGDGQDAGYSIPKNKGKGSVFISALEMDQESVFKAFLRADGLTAKEAEDALSFQQQRRSRNNTDAGKTYNF